MKHKKILCAMCALLCIMFAFMIIGCGSNYTDEDDYANFVKWQKRYETEKELVGLLREYDSAYSAYITYIKKTDSMHDKPVNSSIAFVFEGRTILTDENIRLANVVYDTINGYSISISFDSIGTSIFAEFTSNNIGGTIDIVRTENGYSSVISSPYINAPILDGIATIYGNFSKESADDLCLQLWATCAERNVKQAAKAYNEKQAEDARYANSDYLPTSLAVEPQYSDVSLYLQKAEALGFTA